MDFNDVLASPLRAGVRSAELYPAFKIRLNTAEFQEKLNFEIAKIPTSQQAKREGFREKRLDKANEAFNKAVASLNKIKERILDKFVKLKAIEKVIEQEQVQDGWQVVQRRRRH